MRKIPGKLKGKTEYFGGLSGGDLAVGGGFLLAILLAATSDLRGRLLLCILLVILAALLLLRADSEPNWRLLLHIVRHYAAKRRYARVWSDRFLLEDGGEEKMPAIDRRHRKAGDAYFMEDLFAPTDLKNGRIEYDGLYCGAVLELPHTGFRFRSEEERADAIDRGVACALRLLDPELGGALVKLERPIRYDEHREREFTALDRLKAAYEAGTLSEEQLKPRVETVFDRVNDLRELDGAAAESCWYLTVFARDDEQLERLVRKCADALRAGGLKPRRLSTEELAVFLKRTHTDSVDEEAVNRLRPSDYICWAMPERVELKSRSVLLNGTSRRILRVSELPTRVEDGWLAELLTSADTRAVFKLRPMTKSAALNRLDRALDRQESRLSHPASGSARRENEEQLSILRRLTAEVQEGGECLLACNLYLTVPEKAERSLRQCLQENGISSDGLPFNQRRGWIASQISAYDPLEESALLLPASAPAAGYPWIYPRLEDADGLLLGTSNEAPAFPNLLKRGREGGLITVSGDRESGRTTAVRLLLAQLASDGRTAAVIDPDRAYAGLCRSLHGNRVLMNDGNARLNPFRICGEGSGAFAAHLRLLETFFKLLLPDSDSLVEEELLPLIERLYESRGITAESNPAAVREAPTLDDLRELLRERYRASDSESDRGRMRKLLSRLSGLCSGGRNADLWNGAESEPDANPFTVYAAEGMAQSRGASVLAAELLLLLNRLEAAAPTVAAVELPEGFDEAETAALREALLHTAASLREKGGVLIVVTDDEPLLRKSGCRLLLPMERERAEALSFLNEAERAYLIHAEPGSLLLQCRRQDTAEWKLCVQEELEALFDGEERENSYFSGEEGERLWQQFLQEDGRIPEAEETKPAEAMPEIPARRPSELLRRVIEALEGVEDGTAEDLI